MMGVKEGAMNVVERMIGELRDEFGRVGSSGELGGRKGGRARLRGDCEGESWVCGGRGACMMDGMRRALFG